MASAALRWEAFCTLSTLVMGKFRGRMVFAAQKDSSLASAMREPKDSSRKRPMPALAMSQVTMAPLFVCGAVMTGQCMMVCTAFRVRWPQSPGPTLTP